MEDTLIGLIAKVLAGTQAPRSMGLLGMATKPCDDLRNRLDLFGWRTDKEIEKALRKHLSEKKRRGPLIRKLKRKLAGVD